MTDAEALAILDAAAKNGRLDVQLAVRHVRERLLLDLAPKWSQETLDRAQAMGVELTSPAPHDAYRCTDPACSCAQKEAP